LTGGEPTISPYFFQIINYLYQKYPKINIRVLTNGRLFFYDNFLKKCLNFRNIDFIIPIHGFDNVSHNRITQVPGSFYQTIKGLEKLYFKRKADQKIEIRIIATRLNFKVIPKILKLIKEKFPQIDRVVLILLEFEGKGELNKKEVGITYQELRPILEKTKNYFKFFKDFRLYHFPLCVLTSDFWPYCWRTLPKREVTFLPECKKCLLKQDCLGVHKSYLNYVRKPEIKPILDLKGKKIVRTNDYYKPIKWVKGV